MRKKVYNQVDFEEDSLKFDPVVTYFIVAVLTSN